MTKYPVPRPRIWFQRPHMPQTIRWAFRPVWFGNDEYHRKTVVIGFPWTGEAVVPFKDFDTADCVEDECGPLCPTCGRMMSRSGRDTATDGWLCDVNDPDFGDMFGERDQNAHVAARLAMLCGKITPEV